MTTALLLLRARLAWVQAQISNESSITDPDISHRLIIVGRVDILMQDKAWLVNSIRQLEAEQEAEGR